MYPVVLPLHRSGHDLQAHIVVDGGGGDKALLAAGDGRDEAEILHQQHHHLIHVEPQIRDGIPVRQMVIGDETVPALQLVNNEFLIV